MIHDPAWLEVVVKVLAGLIMIAFGKTWFWVKGRKS